MCGFAGVFARSGSVDPGLMRSMGNVIDHRGPDDAGSVFFARERGSHVHNPSGELQFPADVALAFRRLKIIDLSPAGAQPMSNADGSLWVVFNGEIYNYIELRAELEAEGWRFRSRSDTEVLLAMFERHGPDAFKRLNGMFAAAFFDKRTNQLTLVRDRIGVKPLYYGDTGSDLVFGSEIKALMQHPGLQRGIDRHALAEYLTFHFPLRNRTIFQGVSLLEPGCYATFAGGALTVRSYWSLSYHSGAAPDRREAVADLREILRGALARQVRSDVPIGTYLSGGMDTGSISALAAPMISPFHSFTCGFETRGMLGLESFFDERRDAADLAALLGTIHHEYEVRPEDLERLVPEVMWHLEDPRVGISHQIYKLAQMVRQNVIVVLSGTGGDELFAGYGWRYQPVHELSDMGAFQQRFYDVWARIRTDEQRGELLSDSVAGDLQGWTPRTSFAEELAPFADEAPLHRALAFEMRNFLQGVLLVDDKLTMAHSIESRVPLLDNEVVEFVNHLPAQWKYDGAGTKIILREALRGILPDEVIDRRKQGFTPPESTWMRVNSRRWIESVLLSDQSLERGLFKPDAVRRIVSEHMDGTDNHRFLLWSLLSLEFTQRSFLDGAQPVRPATRIGDVPAETAA